MYGRIGNFVPVIFSSCLSYKNKILNSRIISLICRFFKSVILICGCKNEKYDGMGTRMRNTNLCTNTRETLMYAPTPWQMETICR